MDFLGFSVDGHFQFFQANLCGLKPVIGTTNELNNTNQPNVFELDQGSRNSSDHWPLYEVADCSWIHK